MRALCCVRQAPGYSAMISRPMAFNTIRAKLAAGEYDGDKAWDDLQQDMATMFTNAMTYNPPDTFVHKQVRRLRHIDRRAVCQSHPAVDGQLCSE